MAVKRELFEEVGGFDEALDDYSIIDFCLKCDRKLRRNIYIPYIKLLSNQPLPSLRADDERYQALVEKFDIPSIDRYSNVNYEAYRLEAFNVALAAAAVAEPVVKTEQTEASIPAVPSMWDKYSSDASALAQWYDFSINDLTANEAIVKNSSYAQKSIHTICWLLPDFDYASYAGLYTIFRVINHLQVNYGVDNRIAIVGQPDLRKIRNETSRLFPALNDCPLYEVTDNIALGKLPFVDAAVSSLWTTAYMLLKFNKTYKKFYFIQDFEPYFYPAGSTFAQAAESYKFGFFGITNTQGLKSIYENEYDGVAHSLTPCVDEHVFFLPEIAERTTAAVKKVFFYGRPGHPRNGFELGAAALRELKRRMGEKVDIVSAGAEWSPRDYWLDGVVNNLGRLPYEKTGDLYRSCHAGFVMMFTKHPSYLPFELMACGCPVVSNENDATKWFLKDGENCSLTQATATRIAETIKYVLDNEEFSKKITTNAQRNISQAHSNWSQELDKLWMYMKNPLLLEDSKRFEV